MVGYHLLCLQLPNVFICNLYSMLHKCPNKEFVMSWNGILSHFLNLAKVRLAQEQFLTCHPQAESYSTVNQVLVRKKFYLLMQRQPVWMLLAQGFLDIQSKWG